MDMRFVLFVGGHCSDRNEILGAGRIVSWERGSIFLNAGLLLLAIVGWVIIG